MDDEIYIWLALALLVTTIAVALSGLARNRIFIAFGAFATFIAGMVVVYVIQIFQAHSLMTEWYGAPATAYTLILASLAIAFVYLGYRGRYARRIATAIPAIAPQVNLDLVFWFSVVAMCVGVLAYIPLVATAPSFTDWLNIPRGGTDWETASSFAKGLTRLVETGILLQLFVVHWQRRGPMAVVLAWILFACALWWNFYLGARSGVILLVTGAVAAYYVPKRRNPNFLVLFAIFTGLYVAVTFQETFRLEFYGLRFNLDQYSAEELVDAVLPGTRRAGDSGGITQRGSEISCSVASVALVPDEIDYNFGYPLLELVTRWIPRSIWPDKGYPLYEALTPLFLKADLSTTWIPYATTPILAGPAMPFVAYWYAMGGLLTVVIAAYLTGMMLWIIDSLYFDRRHGFGGAVLLIMLSVVGFSEAAATPTTWIFSAPFVLIPAYVMLRFVRRRAPQRVYGPPPGELSQSYGARK